MNKLIEKHKRKQNPSKFKAEQLELKGTETIIVQEPGNAKLKITIPSPSKSVAVTVVSKNEEASSHGRIPPSTLRARELCEGFRSSSKRNDAADEGTMLHKHLEDPKLSRKKLTRDQLDWLAMCEDYIKDLKSDKKLKPIKELEVDLKFLEIDGMDKGTFDLLVFETPTKAHLVDFKFGFIEVDDAEENIQLHVYALGVFHKFPELTEVHVHILQPKLDSVSTAIVTMECRESIILRVTSIVARSNKAIKQLTPNSKSCRFCALKENCEGLKAITAQGSQIVAHPNVKWQQPFTELKPDDRGQLVAALKLLKTWAETRLKEANATAADGGEFTGWALKERSGAKSIDPSPFALGKIKKMFKLTDADVQAICEPKIGLLSEVIAARDDSTKKSANQYVVKTLEQEKLLIEGAPSFFLVEQ